MPVKKALVVHPDVELITNIYEQLTAVGAERGCSFVFSKAKNRKSAEESGKGPFDLVVTSLAIPVDSKSAVGAGEENREGLELIEALRAASPAMGAILIVTHMDNELSLVAHSKKVEIVAEGRGFEELLRTKIKDFLGEEPSRVQRVEVLIALKKRKGCVYEFRPEGGTAEDPAPLTVSPAKFEELQKRAAQWERLCGLWLKESRGSSGCEDSGWAMALEDVSQALRLEESPANREFLDRLAWWQHEVGGIRNIRVRFALDSDDMTHRIPVEAFKVDKDYWMLETATYRSLDFGWHADSGARTALSWREVMNEGVNILIIQAEVSQAVQCSLGERSISLDPLPNVEKETKKLRRLFVDLQEQACKKGVVPSIGKVRIVDRGCIPDEGSFKDELQKALAEGPWHIVHYSGHSYFDQDREEGYLFLPEGVTLEPVPIEEFARYLQKADTQFVFLSSCQGGQQEFIYHLSKERVPAVMGFLLPVNDIEATSFAECFYQNLLTGEHGALDYACLEARREMKRRYRDSPIFASAILVIRSGV